MSAWRTSRDCSATPCFSGRVWNTFYFNLLTVPALAAIGLGLALALNRGTRGAAFLRGIFFSSSVLSVTIVTLLWRVGFCRTAA